MSNGFLPSLITRLKNSLSLVFYTKRKSNVEFCIQSTGSSKEGILECWISIWTPVRYHKPLTPTSPFEPTTADKIKQIKPKALNWEALGINGVHYFWYNNLTSLHEKIVELFNNTINGDNILPQFSSEVIPSDPQKRPSEDTSKYRLITCLPTICKILKACSAHHIYEHLDRRNILAKKR